jgi:hypothetical protein
MIRAAENSTDSPSVVIERRGGEADLVGIAPVRGLSPPLGSRSLAAPLVVHPCRQHLEVLGILHGVRSCKVPAPVRAPEPSRGASP